MGVHSGQYPIFTMLKKRILDVAINEINEKTDISVSYELERYGRKVTHLLFSMSKKKTSLPSEEAQESIRKKLIAFGIKKSKVEQLLEYHDEQYLWENIAIVEQQAAKGNIKNITAYLLQSFSNDYRQQETEYDKQQESLAKENAFQKEEEENRLELLKAEFFKKRDDQCQDILDNLNDLEKGQLESEFTEKMLSSPVLANVFKTKGINSRIMQQQRKQFIIKRYLAEEYRDFEIYHRSTEQRSGTQ